MKNLGIVILASFTGCAPPGEENLSRREMPMERYNFVRERFNTEGKWYV